eukprot:SAG11_NODE_3017_length_2760_cov_2.538519_3_plen_56_part_00
MKPSIRVRDSARGASAMLRAAQRLSNSVPRSSSAALSSEVGAVVALAKILSKESY